MVLAAYYGIAVYQLAQKSQHLAELEGKQTALSESIEAYQEQAALKAASADPEAELQALAAERDARISMLRDMTQQASRSNTTFSSLLTALARQDQHGIWLERIEFRNGGDAIALEGRTLKADELPTYLRRLGTEPGFGHRSFRRFDLSRTDVTEAGLRFRIATLGEDAETTEERR